VAEKRKDDNQTEKTVIASKDKEILRANQPPDPTDKTVIHADPMEKTVVGKAPHGVSQQNEEIEALSDQTMETMIQADLSGSNLDQTDQTMATQIQVPEDDVLADQTMETMISGGDTEVNNKGTQETVMLDSGIMKPAGSSGTRAPGSNAKYKVLKSLGKGGFAWVYLVLNLDLNRREAMKILNSELANDEDVLERFVKEAQISAKFEHQNIVMVYDVQKRGDWSSFEADQKIKDRHREPFAYFTMSFVEGHTATELIHKTGRIKQKEAIKITIDTCAALEYAHGRGVVHRDVKPDNILVDNRGNGIVMDFGIAKAADATRQTAAGTFMGTARYVSPEQAMGKEIDGRSDIYSLGVTLYELTTGTVPFDSDQWMTVLYQHINEPPPAPEKYFEGIDRDLRATILTMLEKKPEDRFQTAGEAHQALCSVFQKMGGTERKTEALDQIVTRRDVKGQGQTKATEHLLNKPPVRTAKHEEVPVQPQSSKPKGMYLIAALVLIGVVSFGIKFFISPKPVTPTVQTSSLYVSAFPRGELVEIRNEDGEAVPIESNALPQRFSLPVGTYKLTVIYKNTPKHIDAIVVPDRVTNTRAKFEVDMEQFLIEGDLK